jgi:hypothetical protein
MGRTCCEFGFIGYASSMILRRISIQTNLIWYINISWDINRIITTFIWLATSPQLGIISLAGDCHPARRMPLELETIPILSIRIAGCRMFRRIWASTNTASPHITALWDRIMATCVRLRRSLFYNNTISSNGQSYFQTAPTRVVSQI